MGGTESGVLIIALPFNVSPQQVRSTLKHDGRIVDWLIRISLNCYNDHPSTGTA